jgi:hypothetical protein
MAGVDLKQQLGYIWVSETSTSLVIKIRVVYQAEWEKIVPIPLGVPEIPDIVLDGMTSLANAIQLIPSYIAKGATLPDESKTIHATQNTFRLDKISGFTRVDEKPYSYASVLDIGVPSFYEATAYYVIVGGALSEIPESMAGLTRWEGVDDRDGTIFLPDKEDLWVYEHICATAHQTLQTTSFELTTGLDAYMEAETSGWHRPHILLDYTQWTLTNYFQRYAEIAIGYAHTSSPVGKRKYYYYNGAVVDQLCFLWWSGPDFHYYPGRDEPTPDPPDNIPPPTYVVPPIIAIGKTFGPLVDPLAISGGGLPYPYDDDGSDRVLMGEHEWDVVWMPQGPVRMG